MTEYDIVGKSKPTSPLFKSKEYSTTATSLGSSAVQNLARLMYITSQVGIDDHIGRVSMMHASMRFLEPIVNFTSSIFNPDKISYGRLLRFTTAKGFGRTWVIPLNLLVIITREYRLWQNVYVLA